MQKHLHIQTEFTRVQKWYIHEGHNLPVLKIFLCGFFSCLACDPFLGLVGGVQHLTFLRVIQ
jgi:hypothetical protein